MVPNVEWSPESHRELVKARWWALASVSDSIRLTCGMRICISDKRPCDVDSASLGTPLCITGLEYVRSIDSFG